MAYYKVIMNYPAGKVEEIDEYFRSIDAARKFGEHLKGLSIANSPYIDAEFKQDPYFIIVEKDEDKTTIVFDSRS